MLAAYNGGKVKQKVFLILPLDLPTVESPIFQRTQIKEPSMYLFTVPNMTCGGCAKSVTKALQIVDAAAKIETDPPKREVRVESSATEADLRAVLTEAGYPAEGAPAAA